VDKLGNVEVLNYANTWDLWIKKDLNSYIYKTFMVFFINKNVNMSSDVQVKCFLTRVQCLCAC